jgi:hypothetical protein
VDVSGGNYVTHEECGEISRRVLEKLESMEKRLFKDNGTLSIQTRIERHEQILRVLLWALSIIVGTVLTSSVMGLILLFKWAVGHGAVV